MVDICYFYLFFMDGDCIFCVDFFEMYVKFVEFGYFFFGGYCKFFMFLSEVILVEDI